MPNAPTDRTFRHARREAVFVGVVLVLALGWTVGYCYLRGYRHPPESWPVRTGLAGTAEPPVHLILGLPAWVVFGVIAPWLVCSAVTVWFGLFGMPDDDLGGDPDDPHPHGP
jgi:hypothetical protein